MWNQTTTNTYTLGQLTSTTDDDGKTLNYAYNHAGLISCIAYPVSTSTNCSSTASGTNTIVKRTFDALGRVSTVTDWLGNTTTYAYADSSTPTTPTTITYPTATGVTANYGYDNAGNLNSLSAASTVTSGTAISDTWQFDSDERLVVSSINGSTGSWAGYNANKQIIAAPNLATSTSDDSYTVATNGAITSDTAPSGSTTSFGYNAGSELCWQANVAASSLGVRLSSRTRSASDELLVHNQRSARERGDHDWRDCSRRYAAGRATPTVTPRLPSTPSTSVTPLCWALNSCPQASP